MLEGDFDFHTPKHLSIETETFCEQNNLKAKQTQHFRDLLIIWVRDYIV